MDKETLLKMTFKILSDTVEFWIREINTEGSDFNFDSQDIYRSAYEDCVTKWKLIEEYPPEVFSDLRVELTKGISDSASKIVELYEKHKNLFRQYDREKLMLDTYKKRNPHYSNCPDVALKAILGLEMEILSRDKYYKSTFYKQYGFLLNDYHFELCVFCRYLLNEIKSNFKEVEPYKTFIENADLAPYFSMDLIYKVYKYCNGGQFEKLSELDFYKSINLLSLYPNLKIAKSENKRAYYVLHKFMNCIRDKEVQNYWINEILHHLGRDYDNYHSKYRDVVSGNATEDDKVFADDIDKIFKSHII